MWRQGTGRGEGADRPGARGAVRRCFRAVHCRDDLSVGRVPAPPGSFRPQRGNWGWDRGCPHKPRVSGAIEGFLRRPNPDSGGPVGLGHLIVVQAVGGSSPLAHPSFKSRATDRVDARALHREGQDDNRQVLGSRAANRSTSAALSLQNGPRFSASVEEPRTGGRFCDSSGSMSTAAPSHRSTHPATAGPRPRPSPRSLPSAGTDGSGLRRALTCAWRRRRAAQP
jgi:hypothetical protein